MPNTIAKVANMLQKYVEKEYQQDWMLGRLADLSYQGEVVNKSDTVKVRTLDNIVWTEGLLAKSGDDQVVADFNIGFVDFKVETSAQTKALKVKKIEQILTDLDLLEELGDSIKNGMKDIHESHFFAKILADADAGNAVAVTGLTQANIYDNITLGTLKLDDAKIPEANRFIAVAPSEYRLLKLAKIFDNTEVGAELRKAGVVGFIDGMEVFKTTSLKGTKKMIVGVKGVANFVKPMAEIEINKATKSTSWCILGDTVYQAGAKGKKAKCFSVITFT